MKSLIKITSVSNSFRKETICRMDGLGSNPARDMDFFSQHKVHNNFGANSMDLDTDLLRGA